MAAGLRAAAVLVVTGLALAAGPAMAQSGSQSLYVRNSGSVPLEDIRVSPDYSTRWGGDRLGAVVEPGDGVTVDLGDHENDCFFDVQVGNANGESREFWGVNVCDQRHLEVR
ncbi:MAG: hypothetical protein GVY13_18690 [Alphaproteobacteria bacterium]|nr:hypothetical protein [Alphaproteobacteria bacterium]